MYRTAQQGTRVSNAAALPLADPITVETRVGHPIGPHGGLGPSAFSCSLLPVPAGFPGGKTIGNGVDGAPGCTDGRTDGCTDNEPGPWHTRRRTVPAPRRRTRVVKPVRTTGISLVTSAAVMPATIGIPGTDAGHLPLLFLVSIEATTAVGRACRRPTPPSTGWGS